MFAPDSRFFCCSSIKRLKGNTGDVKNNSGAVPATVIPVDLKMIETFVLHAIVLIA